MKILVTNVIEPIKRSESKKLAGNVFACSANKLAFIGWLYSTRPISNMAMLVSKYIGGGGGGVIWNTTVLGTSSEPYTKI